MFQPHHGPSTLTAQTSVLRVQLCTPSSDTAVSIQGQSGTALALPARKRTLTSSGNCVTEHLASNHQSKNVTAALVTPAAHRSIDRCHTSGPARSYAAAVLRGSGPTRQRSYAAAALRGPPAACSGLQRSSQRLQRHISRARTNRACHERLQLYTHNDVWRNREQGSTRPRRAQDSILASTLPTCDRGPSEARGRGDPCEEDGSRMALCRLTRPPGIIIFSMEIRAQNHLICLNVFLMSRVRRWDLNYYWGRWQKPLPPTRARLLEGGKRPAIYRCTYCAVDEPDIIKLFNERSIWVHVADTHKHLSRRPDAKRDWIKVELLMPRLDKKATLQMGYVSGSIRTSHTIRKLLPTALKTVQSYYTDTFKDSPSASNLEPSVSTYCDLRPLGPRSMPICQFLRQIDEFDCLPNESTERDKRDVRICMGIIRRPERRSQFGWPLDATNIERSQTPK
ncbi:hypothetical protein FB45DRAFT_868579 [Roridomyces roridus]|uniref:Uncharacterized protein n=1 Tax=Roridomyces roridus TaxID=1738132 RepID=A0AAD7BQK7_9AGAR|nr:hypothetical protein FB45DRAFT_868579 [Roridomyces roridus]